MATSTGLSTALVNELLGIYTDAENKMLEKLAKRAKKGATTPGWTESKFNDINKLKKELEELAGNTSKLSHTLTNKGIVDAYKHGVNTASKDLGIPLTIMNDFIPAHLQRLILDTHNLLEGTQVQILRNTQDVYRSIIAETSTGILTGVDTRIQATQDALNRFAAQGITSFIDKAGRKWEMGAYAEMAVRTATSRAALQGHMDRQTELGYDLMKISSIGTTCPICMQWQGQIVSISGKSFDYPSLDFARSQGLFHPNCKHTVMAWYENEDGTPMIEDTPRSIQSKPNADWLYQKTQEQRYNERQIRKWKRLEAVAITPVDKIKAQNRIKLWQAKQRELIASTDLKRQYGREGVRVGDASKVFPSVKKPFDKPEPKPLPTDEKQPKTKQPKVAEVPKSGIPEEKDLLFLKDGKDLGGAGNKLIYFDANDTNKEFIFKPATTKSGNHDADYKAYAQEAVSKLHRIVNPEHGVDIKTMYMDGKLGSMQEKLKLHSLQVDLPNFQNGYVDDLPNMAKEDLLQEHITDWLTGNFDSHGKNFIKLEDGHWVGIDKEQAFRYLLKDSGSHSMNYSYHPNDKYGENEPIYNTLFRRFAKGEIDLDLDKTNQFLKVVESIPEVEYREMFRAYATSRADGDLAEVLLDKIVERKQNLRAEYEKFYSSLISERMGKPMQYKFGSAPKAIKVKPIPKAKMKKVKKGAYADRTYEMMSHSEVKQSIDESSEWFSKPENFRYREAIHRYTGNGYQWMNNYFRNNRALDGWEKEYVNNMVDMYTKAPMAITKDTELYRATGFSYLKNANINDKLLDKVESLYHGTNQFRTVSPADLENLVNELRNQMVDTIVEEKSFTSVSYRRGAFGSDKPIQLTIKAPHEEAQAIQIAGVSSFGDEEAEILFGPSMHNIVEDIQVDKMPGKGKPCINIIIRLLGHNILK